MVREVRCSGLARPMQCPGSLFFTDLPPQEESAAAREGTAAGEYLQFLCENEGHEPKATHAKNGVMFDDDMKFYAREIYDRVNAQTAVGVNRIRCETRIDWQSRGGIMIRGQYDMSFIGKDGRLHIHDLKYGWGIVEVKENWQLLGYAIGEVIRRGVPFDVTLTIHQPRPHHEDGPSRTWELSYAELLSYKERIDRQMEKIAAGMNTLQTGEKCRYCPAAAVCPALNKAFYRGIEVAQEFVQDSLSDAELAFQLDLVNRISEVVKIKADSLKALAVDRIKRGGIVPGWVTEQSYGDRRWKPGISPDVIETLTGRKVVEQSMVSPAKAEKMGIPKEFLASLVDRHFLGVKLVKKDATTIGDKIFGKAAPK